MVIQTTRYPNTGWLGCLEVETLRPGSSLRGHGVGAAWACVKQIIGVPYFICTGQKNNCGAITNNPSPSYRTGDLPFCMLIIACCYMCFVWQMALTVLHSTALQIFKTVKRRITFDTKCKKVTFITGEAWVTKGTMVKKI